MMVVCCGASTGEQQLRDSGLEYTIVKPPVLTDDPAGLFKLHIGAYSILQHWSAQHDAASYGMTPGHG